MNYLSKLYNENFVPSCYTYKYLKENINNLKSCEKLEIFMFPYLSIQEQISSRFITKVVIYKNGEDIIIECNVSGLFLEFMDSLDRVELLVNKLILRYSINFIKINYIKNISDRNLYSIPDDFLNF